MQCNSVRERLMEFALGELPCRDERGLILEHLEGCDACAAELEEVRATLGALDVWEIEPPDSSMVKRTLSALDLERQAEE